MSNKGKFINALFDKDTEFWAKTDKGERVKMMIVRDTVVKIKEMPLRAIKKAGKILDKHG